MIVYMSVLPIADVRARLSRLVDEAEATHERVDITRNGRRAAVLLGAEDYDALPETIAVLSDPELLSAHHEGMQALVDGDVVDEAGLSAAMRAAGRTQRRR